MTARSLTTPPCRSPGEVTSAPSRRLSRCACCALTSSSPRSQALWLRLLGGALWSPNPLPLSPATMTPLATHLSSLFCPLAGNVHLQAGIGISVHGIDCNVQSAAQLSMEISAVYAACNCNAELVQHYISMLPSESIASSCRQWHVLCWTRLCYMLPSFCRKSAIQPITTKQLLSIDSHLYTPILLLLEYLVCTHTQ